MQATLIARCDMWAYITTGHGSLNQVLLYLDNGVSGLVVV